MLYLSDYPQFGFLISYRKGLLSVEFGEGLIMAKTLHIIKAANARFQLRCGDSAGEGHGVGRHAEFQTEEELKQALRSEGASDPQIDTALGDLAEADNAEIRF